METSTDTKQSPAAYFAFKTLLNTADRMKPVGAPPEIDRSVLVGMSGAGQTQFIAGLKSLGLIDERGKVQPRFSEFVKAEPADRKRLMGEILREKYPEAVDLGSQNATTEMLVKVFTEKYGVKRGDTARKAIGFYLQAARFAEDIPVSPNFTTPRLRSGDAKSRNGRGRTSRVAKLGGGAARGELDDDEFQQLHPAVSGVLGDLPSQGKGWTEEQRDKFMRTFAAVVDYAIPVVEEEEFDEEEPEEDVGDELQQ